MGSPRDSHNSTHLGDWERQREQLSAFVDGELSAPERVALERHVAGCAQCQAELAQLRQVRALLRSLPTPAAPRSFALPAVGAQTTRPSPSGVARRDAVAVAASPIYRASRWVGGIAASLGLALLLGSGLVGLLSAAPHPNTLMNSAAPAIGSRSTAASPSATPPNSVIVAPSGTNTPGAGAVTFPPPTPTPNATAPAIGTTESPPLAPLAGAGLLTGGVIVLVAGSATRRRRKMRS